MNVIKAIKNIMAEISAIEKSRRNPQQGYAFRGIDDIYNSLKPLLAKHGVVIVPKVLKHHREERESRGGGVLIYTILEVEFKFFAEDGSFLEAITIGEAMDGGDKSANKAMSAAMKYVCLQVFCIPTEGDNDTENTTHEVAPKTNFVDYEILSHQIREVNGKTRHGFKLKTQDGETKMAGTEDEGIANKLKAALANGDIVSLDLKNVGKINEIVRVG